MPFPANMFVKQKEEALMQLALFNAGGGVIADSAQILRRRVTLAEVNAGLVVLPPIFGFHYRIHDMSELSVGGAAGGATTVDITGTVAAAVVKLLAVAIAALTQSALVRAGAANATILADGGSFVDLDSNTGVSVSKTGAALTTSTFIDIQIVFDLVSDT